MSGETRQGGKRSG